MTRVLSLSAVGLVAGALVAGTLAAGVVTGVPAAAADLPVAAGAYVALAPVRALDTRTGGAGALHEGEIRALDLTPVVASTSATAVVLNLTVTAPSAPGYLTVYPAGSVRPQASSINKRTGETRSNSVTVALPTDGSRVLDVYNQAGSTPVVVDVLGFYDATPRTGSATYFPADSPFRAEDTRTDGRGPLRPGGSLDLTVPGPLGADAVTAVAVNLTAVSPAGPGYLTAWNGTGRQPGVSTVNFGQDPVTPNFAVVPAVQDADGIHVTVGGNVSATDVLVDVVGWYSAGGAGGALYAPVPPQRIADTRTTGSPLRADEARGFPVPAVGRYLVAVNVEATAVDATAPTFLTAYPGPDDRPTASNLNPFTPDALANAVQVAVAPFGQPGSFRFQVYDSQGAVDVVLDLQGYFVPPTATPA